MRSFLAMPSLLFLMEDLSFFLDSTIMLTFNSRAGVSFSEVSPGRSCFSVLSCRRNFFLFHLSLDKNILKTENDDTYALYMSFIFCMCMRASCTRFIINRKTRRSLASCGWNLLLVGSIDPSNYFRLAMHPSHKQNTNELILPASQRRFRQ